MNRCCEHPADEHHRVTACQEVTHYPSEDYPCLCTGFEGGEACGVCHHPRASHVVTRVCAQCECRTQEE